MDINRTGSRSPHFEDPAQTAQRTSTRFQSGASDPVDSAASVTPAGVPSGVTQADLRDPRKTEETLMQCFDSLVDRAGGQLGVPISNAQKQNLVEFLGNDPVMRAKLINYLEQAVK